MTDVGLMVEITRLETANEYAFGELAKLRAELERLRMELAAAIGSTRRLVAEIERLKAGKEP